MKMSAFANTFSGMKAERSLNRSVLVMAMGVMLVLAFLLAKKEQVLVPLPMQVPQDAWVSNSDASKSYFESWAFSLATIQGNVTPGNVDFVKTALGPLLSPRIHGDVIALVEQQALSIKEDRITIRFEPRFSQYEPSSNKVFVYGYSYMKGPSGNESRQERTYEYQLRIANFAPVIDDLDTYVGKPKDEKVITRLNAQKEKEAKRARDAKY